MNPSLLKNVSVSIVKATQASAGTAINTDSVDMQGWESVVFLGGIATANAGNYVNAADSADDVTFGDLAATKVTPGSNNESFAIDIVRPVNRYVRLEFVRAGANTVLESVYAIRYNGRKAPITNDNAETHVSPAQGTA